MKMKSIQYWGPGDIRFEEISIKPLEEGEVLVKVESALTCGTDVKTFKRGHPVLIKQIPSGFGHEFAGTIAQLGKNVEGFEIGDRVVAANSAPCGKCFFCKKEEYNLCENLDLLNGAYAEYITVPARIVQKNMLKLPDDLSFDKAAFCEPLANVVHGVERTEIKPGQTVGIIGIGPIGLMFAKLAKLKGAKVIAAGRNPLKLELAKSFSQADEVVDLTKYPNPEKIFMEFTEEGKGLDVAVECVGLPSIWERIFSMIRPGGTVHFFGGCKSGSTVTFDTTKMHYGDIKMISVFHHTPKYFKKALDLISSGQVPVEKLITETISLKEVQSALEKHIEGNAIKFLVKPWS
ncbi:MAG TPA: alcohol dehydrogenase catalytic domain-containing protein [Candidatus Gastranaerophilaceae bacterium]|nr:alcohol dehydrogenase catalytic domain-containing protein [Candidatus Gastranaerophilaceae bacterium]HPT41237.1 alcohol dehydrogenase catalytic domain-containing protein [Candidatus Gastranaerophilaceae bacterium]